MYLLIDQGNTRCKYLLTESLQQLDNAQKGAWDNHHFEKDFWVRQLESFADKPLKRVIVGSVASHERKEWFKELSNDVLGLEPIFAASSDRQVLANGSTLYNSYQQPKALGVDRWLVMIEGLQLTEAAFIVIDAGTAITLDVVDGKGQHLGGHIVPGVTLVERSLLGETQSIAWSAGHDSRLDGELLGNNTSAAVAFGAEVMVLGYIKEVITQLDSRKILPEQIIITGGGASMIEKAIEQIPEPIFAKLKTEYRPDLVLEGLSRWFSLNN